MLPRKPQISHSFRTYEWGAKLTRGTRLWTHLIFHRRQILSGGKLQFHASPGESTRSKARNKMFLSARHGLAEAPGGHRNLSEPEKQRPLLQHASHRKALRFQGQLVLPV